MDYIKRFQVIDGYKILKSVYSRTIDPEETHRAVLEKYQGQNLSQSELKRAYEENIQYSDILENEEAIAKEEYLALIEKIKNLEKNKQITTDGNILPDNRDIEYWINTSGNWSKIKIEHLNENIPGNAVMEKDFTSEQRKEISDQKEAARIASLTPEEREHEKITAINSAKTAARIRKEEAEIADEPDDSKEWFQQQKAQILAKYA